MVYLIKTTFGSFNWEGVPYLGGGVGGMEFPVRLTIYTPHSVSFVWGLRL